MKLAVLVTSLVLVGCTTTTEYEVNDKQFLDRRPYTAKTT